LNEISCKDCDHYTVCAITSHMDKVSDEAKTALRHFTGKPVEALIAEQCQHHDIGVRPA